MEETSKKVRHTPGPWKIDELAGPIDGEEFITIEYEGMPICEVRGTNDMSCLEDDELGEMNKMVIANAFLIAAAPSLLEALEELYSLTPDINYMTDTSTDFENALVQAIEKAKQAIKLAKRGDKNRIDMSQPIDCLVKNPVVEKHYKSLSKEDRLRINLDERESILKLLTNNLKEYVKLTILNEKP